MIKKTPYQSFKFLFWVLIPDNFFSDRRAIKKLRLRESREIKKWKLYTQLRSFIFEKVNSL